MEIERAKKKNSSLSAAEKVGSVDDLLIQIMQRLPLKQTITLQVVSKQWNRVSNYVLANWTSFYPRPNPAAPKGLLSVITPPAATNMEIVQSCNGLLLCRTYHPTYAYYVSSSPTLQTCHRLPLPLEHLGIWVPGDARRMSLAYDPDKSPNYYSAVNVRHDGIYVYSSQTGVWKHTADACPFRDKFDYSQGVYCNGSVHWIREGYYFNMESYQLNTMPLLEAGPKCYFGESRGHLYYIEDSTELKFVVFQLKKDYSRWFMKYRVDLSTAYDTKVFNRNNRKRQCAQVVDVIRRAGGRDKHSFLVLMVNGIFARYNLVSKRTRTVEKLHQIQIKDNHRVGYRGFRNFMWDLQSVLVLQPFPEQNRLVWR